MSAAAEHPREVRIRALIAAMRRGDPAAEATLLAENHALCLSIARRFAGRGLDVDDLTQLAALGFIKAARRFDPAFGVCFSTYAVPLMMGEIRRALRDSSVVKVSRSLRERAVQVLRCREALAADHHREPTLRELAQALALTPEAVAEALDALRDPVPLDAPAEEGAPDRVDALADPTQSPEALAERLAVREALRRLTPRERTLVELRYFRDRTQTQTAEVLGVSQVQVSRLEGKIMGKLRAMLGE